MNNTNSSNRLSNFHITFFAIALGFIGYVLTLQRAEAILSFPHLFHYVLVFTGALIAVEFVLYFSKWLIYPHSVKKEMNHPIKVNFFPIWAKIFLISSIIVLPLHLEIARWLWFIGVALQFFFSITILSKWIRNTSLDTKHLNPAWFIPIVGNVIVPIAGTSLGYQEVSWFFFSIGLVMWLVMFSLVFNRMLFYPMIPEKLLPSLFILFAPPTIAFISYVKLTGNVDSFAKILYYISLFLWVLVLSQFSLLRKIRFFLSWWAYSFPMVAISVATMLMYHETHLEFFRYLALTLVALLSIIMVILIFKTLKAIFNKDICIDED